MTAYEKLIEALRTYSPANGTDQAMAAIIAPAIEGLPWSFPDRALLWHRLMDANETAEFDEDTDETYNARARRDVASLIAAFVTIRRHADREFAHGFHPLTFEALFEDGESEGKFDRLADIVRSIGTMAPQPFSAFAGALIELELPDTVFSHLCERFMAARKADDRHEGQSMLADTVILALEQRMIDFDGADFAAKVHG